MMTAPQEDRLFEVPRVKVLLDTSDPTVLKIAFAGSIELDRTNAEQVDWYNKQKHGAETELVVTCYVAGARKIHRRDAEGDIDAIVETKSFVVSDFFFEGRAEE